MTIAELITLAKTEKPYSANNIPKQISSAIACQLTYKAGNGKRVERSLMIVRESTDSPFKVFLIKETT